MQGSSDFEIISLTLKFFYIRAMLGHWHIAKVTRDKQNNGNKYNFTSSTISIHLEYT